MILVDPETADVGSAARSLAESLSQEGFPGIAHDLLVAVDNDIADGQPLKVLMVREGHVYYGLLLIGILP